VKLLSTDNLSVYNGLMTTYIDLMTIYIGLMTIYIHLIRVYGGRAFIYGAPESCGSVLKAFDCVPKPFDYPQMTIYFTPKPSQWHREAFYMTLLSGYKHHKSNYMNPKRSGSCPMASDIRLKPFDRSPEPSVVHFTFSELASPIPTPGFS